MTDGVRASVCMAAYNGERFIDDQVRSILAQLGQQDELVIVDDASTDDTVAVVSAIADPRVRLTASPVNQGYVATFEQALRHARGEYLFLADQDDLWIDGRHELMIGALHDHDVVAGNLVTLGGADTLRGPFGQRDWRLSAATSGHRLRNTLGILAGAMPYYGCAMGVRRSALVRVLPFPSFLHESHDLWLALVGNLAGRLIHLDERVTARRLHDTNQTPTRPRGVIPALRSRLMLLRLIGVLVRRRGI